MNYNIHKYFKSISKQATTWTVKIKSNLYTEEHSHVQKLLKKNIWGNTYTKCFHRI